MKLRVGYEIKKFVDVYVETEDEKIIEAFHKKGDLHSDKNWEDSDTYRRKVEQLAYDKYLIGECVEGEDMIIDRCLIVVEENI